MNKLAIFAAQFLLLPYKYLSTVTGTQLNEYQTVWKVLNTNPLYASFYPELYYQHWQTNILPYSDYCPPNSFCVACKSIHPHNHSVSWLLPFCSNCYVAHNSAQYRFKNHDYLRIPSYIYGLPLQQQINIYKILLDKCTPVQ